MITSEELESCLWEGANDLRGSMDASRYNFLQLIEHMKKEHLAVAVLHADEITVQDHRKSRIIRSRRSSSTYVDLRGQRSGSRKP